MNLEKVINILKEANLESDMYFIIKKSEYYSFSPNVSENIIRQLLNSSAEYIQNFIDLEEVEYNPTGYRDGTREVCENEYVGNYDEVVDSFDSGNIEGIEDYINDFSFFCINVSNLEGENVKLFRRVTKFKRMYSKGLLAAFQGNQLNKIEDKMLGLDGEIDLVAYDGEISILNHISLERIFRINEQFEEKAKQALTAIGDTGKIENFEGLEEDCLNDARYKKILTKMLREGNDLSTCFDNFDNVIATVGIFGLDIEIRRVPDDKIIYNDKSQLMDILRLARDSYYKSLVRELPGIDNKI